MVAALGTATFVKPNGYTVSVDIEIQDAVGDMATWDSGGGAAAGSDHYTNAEALRLIHLSVANVTTAVGIRAVVNGTPTQNIIRHNVHCVSTLAASIAGAPPLNMGFAAGAKIQFIGV